MHAVLFAGGFGQRLWPISRRTNPKQFSALLGGKSFLRIAVERLLPLVPFERIYISTNERFADVILEQIPEMSRDNLILEPERRDLAAAVALAFFTLRQKGIKGDLYFQWSDNYVGNEELLLHAISVGIELVHKEPGQIVFIGQRPRFASENLGWIEQGDLKGYSGDTPYYAFRSWHYRPAPDLCKSMFESGSFTWNTGFFVTTMEFAVSTYQKVAPEIAKIAEEMASLPAGAASDQRRRELYALMPVQHFDEAFLMKVQPDQAVLLNIELDWADPGTLYALKEALQTDTEANVKQGTVVDLDCTDCLLVNEEKKPVSVMGLNGVIVVNTNDAILVISKDSVRHLAKLLSELSGQGFDHLL
jgi:mannose-1-phosphate guanylyltransferase